MIHFKICIDWQSFSNMGSGWLVDLLSASQKISQSEDRLENLYWLPWILIGIFLWWKGPSTYIFCCMNTLFLTDGLETIFSGLMLISLCLILWWLIFKWMASKHIWNLHLRINIYLYAMFVQMTHVINNYVMLRLHYVIVICKLFAKTRWMKGIDKIAISEILPWWTDGYYTPPHFNKVERGVYWFHLVRLSVCPQNCVRSVSSTILVGSILYLHTFSSCLIRCANIKWIQIWNFGEFFKFVTLTLSSFDLGSNMTQWYG